MALEFYQEAGREGIEAKIWFAPLETPRPFLQKVRGGLWSRGEIASTPHHVSSRILTHHTPLTSIIPLFYTQKLP